MIKEDIKAETTIKTEGAKRISIVQVVITMIQGEVIWILLEKKLELEIETKEDPKMQDTEITIDERKHPDTTVITEKVIRQIIPVVTGLEAIVIGNMNISLDIVETDHTMIQDPAQEELLQITTLFMRIRTTLTCMETTRTSHSMFIRKCLQLSNHEIR